MGCKWKWCRQLWVVSLKEKVLLEKEMATHSNSLAWRILWTEEPGGLQSMGLQGVAKKKKKKKKEKVLTSEPPATSSSILCCFSRTHVTVSCLGRCRRYPKNERRRDQKSLSLTMQNCHISPRILTIILRKTVLFYLIHHYPDLRAAAETVS